MKRIIVSGAVAALATISFAGTANAAQGEPASQACFGQVHKAINVDGALGLENVGQAVKLLGGQGKNATANALCTS